MRFRPSFLALALSIVCISGEVPDAVVADILWVPAGATFDSDLGRPVMIKKSRNIFIDGSGAVGFTLTGEREDLSRQITRHFAAAGWRQRQTQELNPQLPTSFEQGWQGHCACLIVLDAQGDPIPRERFYSWQGEWENERGDCLTYHLSAQGRQLRGYAAFGRCR